MEIKIKGWDYLNPDRKMNVINDLHNVLNKYGLHGDIKL